MNNTKSKSEDDKKNLTLESEVGFMLTLLVSLMFFLVSGYIIIETLTGITPNRKTIDSANFRPILRTDVENFKK